MVHFCSIERSKLCIAWCGTVCDLEGYQVDALEELPELRFI